MDVKQDKVNGPGGCRTNDAENRAAPAAGKQQMVRASPGEALKQHRRQLTPAAGQPFRLFVRPELEKPSRCSSFNGWPFLYSSCLRFFFSRV